MQRWSAIQPVLNDFRSYLSPDVPELKLVHANDRGWSQAEYKRCRPEGFPSRMRGVYLIFDDKETLLYVGVAMWNYDKRVWSHDEELKRRYTDIIPFDEEHAFLALALEFFLICNLSPPFNKSYYGYTAGRRRC